MIASWNKYTHDLISSIYGFYFQKFISRSFSGLFQLFLLISTGKGLIFILKTYIRYIEAAYEVDYTNTVTKNSRDDEISSPYVRYCN